MGWNTGFSLVTVLNKGCSLLSILKTNVWQGVYSFVRLENERKLGGIHCFYLWAKHELIWSDITDQTVTLGANLLVMAQTIPQNAKREFFF